MTANKTDIATPAPAPEEQANRLLPEDTEGTGPGEEFWPGPSMKREEFSASMRHWRQVWAAAEILE